MPADTSRADWTSPEYVATVVGVLAVGALVFFAALTRSSPTVDDVTFVVLILSAVSQLRYSPPRGGEHFETVTADSMSITVPATLAYELARRWR